VVNRRGSPEAFEEEIMLVRRLAVLTLMLMGASAIAPAQLAGAVAYSGFTNPLHFVQDPINRNTQYVVQQNGLIRVIVGGIVQPTPFLNLQGQISTGGERGLLDMEFPHNERSGRTFFVTFTDPTGATRVARFQKSAANPLVADQTTQVNILKLEQPFSNHNSATIRFGPDGLLYIGTGDGGSGNDPQNHAQNPQSLLGKVLRINPFATQFPGDPDRHYTIPPDNPFIDGDPIPARHEIWAFGMRNPYKMSWDFAARGGTNGLFIADVGQTAREEINFEPFNRGGRNYGWRVKEGFLFTGLGGGAYQPFTDPIIDLDRTLARSITGGVVYRGTGLPAQYRGRYFFGDYITRRVWSLGLSYDPVSGEASVLNVWEHTAELGGSAFLGNISALEADSSGELFVLDHSGGRIIKISAAP
jgi:glucose/arabinose dehydrogenase